MVWLLLLVADIVFGHFALGKPWHTGFMTLAKIIMLKMSKSRRYWFFIGPIRSFTFLGDLPLWFMILLVLLGMETITDKHWLSITIFVFLSLTRIDDHQNLHLQMGLAAK